MRLTKCWVCIKLIICKSDGISENSLEYTYKWILTLTSNTIQDKKKNTFIYFSDFTFVLTLFLFPVQLFHRRKKIGLMALNSCVLYFLHICMRRQTSSISNEFLISSEYRHWLWQTKQNDRVEIEPISFIT